MMHSRRGPQIRTFCPLPHMRSYIHNNHCQNNFTFAFKHSKRSLNHLLHNRQRDQPRTLRDTTKIKHIKVHKTPNIRGSPRPRGYVHQRLGLSLDSSIKNHRSGCTIFIINEVPSTSYTKNKEPRPEAQIIKTSLDKLLG